MDAVLAALHEQNEVLDGLLTPLTAPDWDRDSACAGWSVGDVVLHLAQTNELAAASATGRLAEAAGRMGWTDPGAASALGDVDQAADLAVRHERGAPAAAVLDRWRRSVADQEAALAACEPSQRVPWVVGDMAARTLATTRLSEAWIHTGDVAAGLGAEQPPADRIWHIARLAHRTLPYAFARAGEELSGPVRFELSSPLAGETWVFGDDQPLTTVAGPALELCRVAGQRADVADTSLKAQGPDAEAVLRLVRTFA